MFTDTLMVLITSLHWSVCKRQGCGCVLKYHKIYVATCLVVWHVGGRWVVQPSCNKIRAGNLVLASALLLSGNSYTKVGLMFNFCYLQYFSSTSSSIRIRSYKSSLPSIPGRTLTEMLKRKRKQSWGRLYYYQ